MLPSLMELTQFLVDNSITLASKNEIGNMRGFPKNKPIKTVDDEIISAKLIFIF